MLSLSVARRCCSAGTARGVGGLPSGSAAACLFTGRPQQQQQLCRGFAAGKVAFRILFFFALPLTVRWEEVECRTAFFRAAADSPMRRGRFACFFFTLPLTVPSEEVDLLCFVFFTLSPTVPWEEIELLLDFFLSRCR